MILLTVGAVIVFVLVAADTIYRFRSMPLDAYHPGSWRIEESARHSGYSPDVRSMIYRLEKAATSAESWSSLLHRLDAMHRELSPFGENVRRPPHVYRTWYGVTRTEPEAPARYNRTYLKTYLETLETLAGVSPDEQ